MTVTKSEIINYLIKEQGYDEKEAKSLPIEDLVDLYEMYHED